MLYILTNERIIFLGYYIVELSVAIFTSGLMMNLCSGPDGFKALYCGVVILK